MRLRATCLHKERWNVGKSCINEFSATSVCIKRTIMSVGLYNGVESYMCLHRERLSVGESCIKDFCATSVYIRRHIVSVGKSWKELSATRV